MSKTYDLHRAARLGDVDEIRAAAKAGTALDRKDEFGATPLRYAIAQKRAAAALLLLELGADPSVQVNDGSTALHSAIEHKMPVILKAMLEKQPAAAAIADKHGNQPLWTAAFNARGNYEMVEMLLQAGADPHHRNNVNLTPLDIPKRTNDPALLKLMEQYGESKG